MGRPDFGTPSFRVDAKAKARARAQADPATWAAEQDARDGGSRIVAAADVEEARRAAAAGTKTAPVKPKADDEERPDNIVSAAGYAALGKLAEALQEIDGLDASDVPESLSSKCEDLDSDVIDLIADYDEWQDS